jgi:hypothetical protein
MALKILQVLLIPAALVFQGLAVNTPVIFRFLPGYQRIFRRLWERHKNPVSWICRPFFGLIFCYGAILESWPVVMAGVIGTGSSWFWFPKLKNTPPWAEEFINKELEILTPDKRWDIKRVVLPSIAIPLGLAALAFFLWYLDYPWNWAGILVLLIATVFKIIWSAKLEGTVLNPLKIIVLAGLALGAIAGVILFILYRLKYGV